MRVFLGLLVLALAASFAVPVSSAPQGSKAQHFLQLFLQDSHDRTQETLKVGKRIPFGEMGVYNLENILSYQSTWGVTNRHDFTETANGGSVDLENGFISLETSTSANGSSALTTVEYGRYEPGRVVQVGIGVIPTTPPTGDAIAEWGAFTDSNGAYFHQKVGSFCVVYENAGTEDETCGVSNFNGETKPDDFDPTVDGAVYVINMNWYGIGGAEYIAYYADEDAPGTLSRWVMHRHAPTNGQSFEDPNLPIKISADNGTSGANVEYQVGGRRYDVTGVVQAEFRRSGDYRLNQTVTASGSPITPLICIRRKSEWPPGSGRTNTVGVYIDSFEIVTDVDTVVWIMLNPDLTGASWGTPEAHVSSETAIETDTSSTSLSNQEAVSGPYLIPGGSGPQKFTTGSAVSLRVQAVNNRPICLVARVPGASDATVDSSLLAVETW